MIRNRFFIYSLIIAAFLSIGCGLTCGLINHIGHKPLTIMNQDQTIFLEKGQGLKRAAYLVEKSGAIQKAWHFQFMASLMDKGRSLQAGEYQLGKAASLHHLINQMAAGKVLERSISIPEGYSVKSVLKLLQKNDFIIFDLKGDILEGSLAPNTYQYRRSDLASDIVTRMQKAQTSIVMKYWQNRSESFMLETPTDVLTLASIIEKETGIASERPLIAAVFLNRLKKRMRLQTDPTVIYGITGGEKLDRPLTKADIKTKTAYNTYRFRGLPPTPIANPGEASIKAIFNPADVDYLYFVADGTGGHVFAKTYKQHKANVRKWRKIRDGIKNDT